MLLMAILGILSGCRSARDLERYSCGEGFAFAKRHHQAFASALGLELQRLWREEGLQRPTPRKRKRARPADGSVRRHRAEHPHQVWAMDFQFDATADGRRLSPCGAGLLRPVDLRDGG